MPTLKATSSGRIRLYILVVLIILLCICALEGYTRLLKRWAQNLGELAPFPSTASDFRITAKRTGIFFINVEYKGSFQDSSQNIKAWLESCASIDRTFLDAQKPGKELYIPLNAYQMDEGEVRLSADWTKVSFKLVDD